MGDEEKAKAESDLRNMKSAVEALKKVKELGPDGAKGLVVIILLIVVCGLCCIGGVVYWCFCKNKGSENEGGEYEDDDLFKKVFEGKTNEEAIIPTSAEENI